MVIIEAVENDDDVIEKEASLNGVNNPPSQSSWSSGEAGVSRFYHQFASAAQTLNSCGGVTTVSHDNNNVFKASNFTSCGNPPNGSYSMVLEQQKQPPLSMTSLSDSNNNSSVSVGGSCFTPRGREDSISEPLRCVFCLERTEKLRQMLCLHSICNVCIEGSPKGSDVCPVCQKPGFTPNESSNHVGSVLSLFGDEGTTNTSDLLPPHSSTPLAMTSGVKGRAAEETTPIKSSSSSGGGGGGGTPHSTTASVSLSSSGTHASSSSSVSGGSRATCTSCEDGSPTFAHCKDCNEALCSSCTYAHGRVKLTKEHRVEYVGSPTTGSKVTAAAANAALTHDRSLALTPRSNDSRSPVLSQGHHHSEGSPLSPEVYTFKNQPRCERHKHLPVTSLCRHCRLLCCEECLRQGRQQHDRHDVIPLHKMLHQVHATRGLIQQANKVLAAQFDERFRAVEAETRHYFDRMHKIIDQRAKSILDNLKTIKNTAMDDSARREEQLDDTLLKFELILSSDGNSGNHSGSGRKSVTANQLLNSSGRQQQQSSEVAKWVQRNHNNNLELSQDISLDQLTTEVSDLMTCCESLSSWSSDSNQLLAGLSLAFDGQLNFLWRNCDQLGAVATLIHHCGEIQSATCASKCEAYGLSSSTAIVGKTSSIYIQTYDFLSRRRRTGGSHMTAFLLQPGGAGESGGNCPPHNRKDLAVIDRNNGVYEISYTPVKEGVHTLRVLMAGADVGCSPLRIHVIRTRSYSNIHLGQPKFIIGKEGNGDGDFCRPWGICCDNSGLIYVADRSNNRIQVFDSQGLFKFKFGQPGNKWGEFDRPASVAVDEHQGGRIVVADKDNHRIQIFERSTGKYLLKFGDKGVKPGQFNYPWDVAVNSKSEILVSDTRNHRLQLFTPEGIMKFVYSLKDAQMPNWQELFDSPRGVCFTPNDDIVCTDFNKHRAVCISSTFEKANYFSQEGDKKGDLKRPQGVCVDPEGHIIIADSRNHRIQAFTQQGVSVGMWGEQGNGLSQLDRPSGICVSPTGLVLVVDFGNSRVVAY